MKIAKSNENVSALAFLSKEVTVTGDIVFVKDLQVAGKVGGKLISESGTLIVEETGRVEAQINVGVCIIYGTVSGNVNAKSRFEVYKTGRVNGDLSTPVLLIEEGAVINGTIGMSKEAGRRPVDESLPPNSEEKTNAKSARWQQVKSSHPRRIAD